MSIIQAKRNYGHRPLYAEPSLATPPAVAKRCDCHGLPMRFLPPTDSHQWSWRCRVDERRGVTIREARKARTTDGHTRQDVWDKSGGACYLCGVVLTTWEEDHVVPLAVGGADTLENCAAACVDCHRAKGSRIYVLSSAQKARLGA